MDSRRLFRTVSLQKFVADWLFTDFDSDFLFIRQLDFRGCSDTSLKTMFDNILPGTTKVKLTKTGTLLENVKGVKEIYGILLTIL